MWHLGHAVKSACIYVGNTNLSLLYLEIVFLLGFGDSHTKYSVTITNDLNVMDTKAVGFKYRKYLQTLKLCAEQLVK